MGRVVREDLYAAVHELNYQLWRAGRTPFEDARPEVLRWDVTAWGKEPGRPYCLYLIRPYELDVVALEEVLGPMPGNFRVIGETGREALAYLETVTRVLKAWADSEKGRERVHNGG